MTVLIMLFVPGVLYGNWLATGQLGERPIAEMINGTGLWAIWLLLISLAITPFARMLDWSSLLLVRRNVGVAAAGYAIAHLAFYVVDENFNLLTVISEISMRFYLTIGFAVTLVLLALAFTSTDGWVRKLRRNWKRLHRLAYPAAALALLHYYIQCRLDVSQPVFISGLFIWLMLWRMTPETWWRNWTTGSITALCSGMAILATLATAGLEFAWYELATGVNVWRVLSANGSIEPGLRPAHWVFVVTATFVVACVARRLAGSVRGRARQVV